MNNLACLPDELGKLSTLRQLEVSDNRLALLPAAFGEPDPAVDTGRHALG
jgi:hypothetical protein